jgi:signal transduction histidine kinase
MNNLVSNAAKFGRAGDTVEISWQREAGRVQVRVTDHGRGIPPEKHKDLFSKFKQLSQDSNAKAAGTGLGLSICKLIVEQHGGSIGCESMPNDHTTFFFTLREPQ